MKLPRLHFCLWGLHISWWTTKCHYHRWIFQNTLSSVINGPKDWFISMHIYHACGCWYFKDNLVKYNFLLIYRIRRIHYSTCHLICPGGWIKHTSSDWKLLASSLFMCIPTNRIADKRNKSCLRSRPLNFVSGQWVLYQPTSPSSH